MKNQMKSIFRSSGRTKTEGAGIFRLLLPSFMGMVVCMVCLSGSAWAWFTAGISTQPMKIQAAEYQVEVRVTGEEHEEVSADSLRKNTEYTVELTASGSASTGYCKMACGGTVWYTAPIAPGETIRFTLIPDQTAAYIFTGIWGSYSGEAAICDGCVIGKADAGSSEDPNEIAPAETTSPSKPTSPEAPSPSEEPTSDVSSSEEPSSSIGNEQPQEPSSDGGLSESKPDGEETDQPPAGQDEETSGREAGAASGF